VLDGTDYFSTLRPVFRVILHSAEPTIEEFCNRLHRGIISQFSHALVWGRSAKFQPQRCGKDHVLMDEDIVQIVKRV